jgi:hypothetical protein
MVERDLPFGERTVQMLKVAQHPLLPDPNHGSLLPNSWRTLYELTKVPLAVLEEALVDGLPNLSDAVALALLVCAYTLRAGLSGHLLRSATLRNSVGLLIALGKTVTGMVGCTASGGWSAEQPKLSAESSPITTRTGYDS